MTTKEAHVIFREWKNFVEINDKMGRIFTTLPKSFLPYTPERIEEALNIVAEEYFNAGDHKMAETIQTSIATLIKYEDDEEALDGMLKFLKILAEHEDVREAYLKGLKETAASWAETKD